MASGVEVTQSLESSSTTKTAGIEGRTIGADTPEVFYSAVTSKKPFQVAAPRRSGLSSSDGVNLSSALLIVGNMFDVGNTIHVSISCRFSNSSGSCVIALALYDGETGGSTPGVVGITKKFSFSATEFTDGGGLYISTSEIVDIHAASYYVPVLVVAPISGTVNIHVEHL